MYIRPWSTSEHTTRDALQTAIGDPVEGLYTTNASISMGTHSGLRPLYNFGLYSYCSYIDSKDGQCSNSSVAFQLQPYSVVLADMPTNYSGLTQGFVPSDLTFTNSHYLGEFSRAAYYLLLMGSICAALAMLMWVTHQFFTVIIVIIPQSVGFQSERIPTSYRQCLQFLGLGYCSSESWSGPWSSIKQRASTMRRYVSVSFSRLTRKLSSIIHRLYPPDHKLAMRQYH